MPDQAPSLFAPPMREQERERGLHAGEVFLYSYLVVTVLHVVSLAVWSDLDILNWPMVLGSLLANVTVIVALAVSLVVNQWAQKHSRDPVRVYVATFRAMLVVFLGAWLVHIHATGSSFTSLTLMIPVTGMVTAWLLGPREAWAFVAVGSAGVVALILLEKAGVLPFFPTLRDARDLPLTFLLERPYVLSSLMLYGAIAIVGTSLMLRVRSDVNARSEALSELTRKLEILAMTDSLTGLLNRRTIMDFIDQELERTARRGLVFSVVMADIDNFKNVNDQYGHAAGDNVLKEIAALLRLNFRPYDQIARIGGEEFLIVIKDVDLSGCRELAERARVSIQHHHFVVGDGRQLSVTVSFGCTAVDPQQPKTLDPLLGDADKALYASKAAGKNRVTVQP